MVGRENLYGAIALLAPIAWPEPFGLVLMVGAFSSRDLAARKKRYGTS